MKKSFIVCMLSLILGISICGSAQKVKAKEADGVVVVGKESHKDSFDINNDGKKENIRFKFHNAHDEEGFGNSISIYVNKRLVKKNLYFTRWYKYKFIKWNKHAYLYLSLGAGNSHGEWSDELYLISKKRMKRVVDFRDVPGGFDGVISIKVKNNKLYTVMDGANEGLSNMHFQSVYIEKDGKVKLKSHTHLIKEYSRCVFDAPEQEYDLKTVVEFNIYKDKKCTQLIGTVPQGTSFKAVKFYTPYTEKDSDYFVSFYLESKDYKGWYTIDEGLRKRLYDKGLTTPFEGISAAG